MRPALLRWTSCQSENTEFIGRAVARYAGERLGVRTEFVDDIPWRRRERMLDEGAIHVGWICGLPYVRRADLRRSNMELLVAPVMEGARYRGRPIYFSDVVVRHDSTAREFRDLRGMRWGCNEPGSHSGYNIVRYQLARHGEGSKFFGKVIETGAHQTTLRMLLSGKVDASAIDSMVLEEEFRRRPTLKRHVRIIETWGPSPAPPWIVSRSLPADLRQQLRRIMHGMRYDAWGRSVLRSAAMKRFAVVSDRDYEPIRSMSRLARHVEL